MKTDISIYAQWEYAALFRDLKNATTEAEREAIQMALKDMDGRIAELARK